MAIALSDATMYEQDHTQLPGHRAELLEPMADRLAQFALASKKPVRVYGMNAFDRRTVHVQLKEHADVETDSEGHGFSRTLVIKANKAEQKPKPDAAADGENA